MNVGSLSAGELSSRLLEGTFIVKTGMFNVRVQSQIPEVSPILALIYGDFPLASPAEFSDFQITLSRSGGLRRWFRRQVLTKIDEIPLYMPLPASHAFPAFEWGLNQCIALAVKDSLIIHAAVIEKDGLAAILPAPPGSGKSTLCAALVNRGWRLLSDELAIVEVSTGAVIPLPRPVSLKNASIDIIQAYAPEAVFSPKVFGTSKGTIGHMKPPTSSVMRAAQSARPAWIIFPKYVPDAKAELTAMSKATGFMNVIANSFNYGSLGLAGFKTAGDLIDRCACYDFSYSKLDDAIKVFSLLEQEREPSDD